MMKYVKYYMHIGKGTMYDMKCDVCGHEERILLKKNETEAPCKMCTKSKEETIKELPKRTPAEEPTTVDTADILTALGEFDLDTSRTTETIWGANDGLTYTWKGRVWCMPPYDNMEFWFEKCYDHGNAIAFVYASKNTKGFMGEIYGRAHSMFVVEGLIRTRKEPYILIAYGDRNDEILKNLTITGKYFPLPESKHYVFIPVCKPLNHT